ncbi:SLD [Candida oxycetoniae]|uniref:Delta 8-(E)-sphingolipid desaturase n=1 Tax=Candida oxycetoniae TaxID=497107 RepID=A0AAI9SW00_9ASCO|nr:SLD [Candida oxycetoniae]KAI3403977.2 SLD [Candida oxycetoniae]
MRKKSSNRSGKGPIQEDISKRSTAEVFRNVDLDNFAIEKEEKKDVPKKSLQSNVENTAMFPFNYLSRFENYLSEHMTLLKAVQALIFGFFAQLVYLKQDEFDHLRKSLPMLFFNCLGTVACTILSVLKSKETLFSPPEFNYFYSFLIPSLINILYFDANWLLVNSSLNYFVVDKMNSIFKIVSSIMFYVLYKEEAQATMPIFQMVQITIAHFFLSFVLSYLNDTKDSQEPNGSNHKSLKKSEIQLISLLLINLLFNQKLVNGIVPLVIFQKLLISLLATLFFLFPVYAYLPEFINFVIFGAIFTYLTIYQLKFVLGNNAIIWLIEYIQHDSQRLFLIKVWIASAFVGIPVVFYFAKSFSLNLRRKIWHLLIIVALTFSPSILFDQIEFTLIALLGMIIVFLLIEGIRLNDTSWLGRYLSNKLTYFQDSKDSMGALNLSYIYLLLGVSFPIVYDYRISIISNNTSATIIRYMGILSLGVGDTLASVIGQRFGTFKWKGSSKSVQVIYEKDVLNITQWLPRHPGGETAALHMVGRDATDEMNAYHEKETVETFKKWKIGEIDYCWENLLPPIQGAIYRKGKAATSKGDDSLNEKLDREHLSSSDVDLTSSSSSIQEEEKEETKEKEEKEETKEKEEKEEKEAASKDTKLTDYEKKLTPPVVPQNVLVNESNENILFPVNHSNTAIVDPKSLMKDYDNRLSRKDMKSIPSLDYKTQRYLRDEYVELHNLIIKNGFYKCEYSAYVREMVKIGSLFLYSISFLKMNHLFLSAVFMGMAWQQGTFIAHDAGHVSITHNYQFDNIFGMLIADWFGGLSLGWWKRNHNVHHLVTNDPVHDPDIQHLPFFAVSVRLFGNVYSTFYEKILWFDKLAQKLIPIQQYMYYPILCFGRFNLYRLSWTYLLMGQGPRKGRAAWFRYFEIAGMSFFFYWFFYLLVFKSIHGGWNRFIYILVSHVSTMLVHVQITLSHFAMSTADLGVSESFPSRQLRTTMDVDCPEWLDFLHGGLQFQAIHHLFPRLPRHNFRRVQPFVIQFCKKVGLSYSIYGFGRGNEIVIGKLAEVAKQCSILLDATKTYDGDLY